MIKSRLKLCINYQHFVSCSHEQYISYHINIVCAHGLYIMGVHVNHIDVHFVCNKKCGTCLVTYNIPSAKSTQALTKHKEMSLQCFLSVGTAIIRGLNNWL